MSAVVALDVGASRIKGALVDADGRRIAELRYPTRRGDGPDAVLRRVCQVAAWLADSAQDTAAAGTRPQRCDTGRLAPGRQPLARVC
jgi:predicted NBD/HSP70 family sugar kinase